MLAAFQHYGLSHIAVLALIALLTVIIVKACKKDNTSYASRLSIAILTFFCFAIYPIHQLFHSIVGGAEDMESLFPFHLCDIAAFICGFALITRKPLMCELAYFWGLAGTMQGLLTPDLNHDFPSPVYLIFFAHHGVIVITALVLPLGLGWRPRQGAALRAFIWVLGYAVAAFIINYILKTNFGFLTHKPEHASLLDIMGPWPWYILVLITMAGLLFYLLALPFRKFAQEDSQRLN